MNTLSRRRLALLVMMLFAVGAGAAKVSKGSKPAPEKAAPASAEPQALLESLKNLSGDHPGNRVIHAKGVMLTGTFEPTLQAALMSRAKHFHFPSAVVARFSANTGLPDIADTDPNAGPHGLAIRFQLPDGGGFTDIVAHSYNGFPVRTGEEFDAFARALAASPDVSAKNSPLARFLAGHPAAKRFVTTPKTVPDSFEGETFYGVNTFVLRDDRNHTTAGRFLLVPGNKGKALSDKEAAARPANFLGEQVREHVKREAIEFDLVFQIPIKGDKLDDATVAWPDNRQRVVLGTVYLTQAMTNGEAAEKQLALNPMNLTDGVEPSDDPLLRVRGSTYAVGAAARGVTASR